MPDLEQCIRHLRFARENLCLHCTYDDILENAITLLKEQDAKIEDLYQFIFRHGGGREIMKQDVDLAFGIVEEVLDTLIEVGNGVTNDMLHAEANKLFGLRYFLTSLFRPSHLDQNNIQADKEHWEEVKRAYDIEGHGHHSEIQHTPNHPEQG